MNTIHIILDNGHGYNGIGTSGKCSPILNADEFDLNHPYVYLGRYREGNSNREIVRRLSEKIKSTLHDVEVHIICPEDANITLGERVRRINKICDKFGVKNCLMISVHSNAAGGSTWANATGMTVHIARNASMRSKDLAHQIYDAAEATGYRGNRSVPRERYWVNDFYIIRNTKCPCVLTENLFYTNKEDLKRLMSERGTNDIVNYHLAGIAKYLAKEINT